MRRNGPASDSVKAYAKVLSMHRLEAKGERGLVERA